MKPPLRLMRDHRRWLGAVLALMLGGALLSASVHHHDARTDRDACVICTAAQTPALTAATTPAPAVPVATAERLRPAALAHHARRDEGCATSRAPPLA